MRKFKSFTRRSEEVIRFDRNQYIRAEQMLVIDESGEKLGVINKAQALELARTKELDLVLVNPQSDPPVAKIIEWAKFKYEQTKKRKQAHKKSKSAEVKEMWFKPNIDEGDRNHKLDRVREFMNKGHKVKLSVRYKRGTPYGKMTETMTDILSALKDEADTEAPPKSEGKNIIVFVKSKK